MSLPICDIGLVGLLGFGVVAMACLVAEMTVSDVADAVVEKNLWRRPVNEDIEVGLVCKMRVCEMGF